MFEHHTLNILEGMARRVQQDDPESYRYSKAAYITAILMKHRVNPDYAIPNTIVRGMTVRRQMVGQNYSWDYEYAERIVRFYDRAYVGCDISVNGALLFSDNDTLFYVDYFLQPGSGLVEREAVAFLINFYGWHRLIQWATMQPDGATLSAIVGRLVAVPKPRVKDTHAHEQYYRIVHLIVIDVLRGHMERTAVDQQTVDSVILEHLTHNGNSAQRHTIAELLN